jgi:hypothetical protein
MSCATYAWHVLFGCRYDSEDPDAGVIPRHQAQSLRLSLEAKPRPTLGPGLRSTRNGRLRAGCGPAMGSSFTRACARSEGVVMRQQLIAAEAQVAGTRVPIPTSLRVFS